MKRSSLATLIGLSVLSGAAFADRQSYEIPHVQGEVLVKIRTANTKGLNLFGAKVKKEMNLLSGRYILVKSQEKSSASLIQELKGHPDVIFAEPNYILRAIDHESSLESMLAGEIKLRQSSQSPADPLYGKLWGLQNTGNNEPDRNGEYSGKKGAAGADVAAEKAWGITKGSRKVTIAVIDTGIDYNHPDLKNNMWVNEGEIPDNGIDDDQNGVVDDVHGYNSIFGTGDPMDGNDHGTHCAGTIGAEHNNGIGVAGVMSDVSLMAVKFLGDDGSGSLADAVSSIDYATRMNVDIMSNSWGGGGYSEALVGAISAAKEKGILFVAAAGNSSSNNDTRPSYPASYEVDNVVSVASHTVADELSSFSSFGKRSVHIAAPGSNIYSTTPHEGYKVLSGTSMATPHVSGVLGLLLAQEGRLPVLDARERLMATSEPGRGYRRTTIGKGRVSAYNLLTNTKIPRQEPNDADWRVEPLSEVFETEHPYENNTRLSQTFTFPGAKFVKLIIAKYDTEMNFDFVTVKDGQGAVMEKLSGQGMNFETDYAEGDSVTVEFSSDSSQIGWGVVVREAKVIY